MSDTGSNKATDGSSGSRHRQDVEEHAVKCDSWDTNQKDHLAARSAKLLASIIGDFKEQVP